MIGVLAAGQQARSQVLDFEHSSVITLNLDFFLFYLYTKIKLIVLISLAKNWPRAELAQIESHNLWVRETPSQ